MTIAADWGSPAKAEPKGLLLVAIVAVLALGNFLAILDLTITNVLVPHISGSLAVAPSDGTWVITSYAVAEAIMVPLTGWLAERFGPVKVFVSGIVGFGVVSILCGLATSLPMLIVFRILLGICGGPLIPLSQTLLLQIVPPRHEIKALAAWGATTIIAPAAGPLLGGWIGDDWSWPWAFYIKVPFALALESGNPERMTSSSRALIQGCSSGLSLANQNHTHPTNNPKSAHTQNESRQP